MGYAKYYEDNVSIYNDRMALKEPFEAAVQHYQVKMPDLNCQKPQIKAKSIKRDESNCRAGLLLHFDWDIDRPTARKLQMNGWWFSKSKSCWCNYNSRVNRQYAQLLIAGTAAQLVIAV